MCIRDSPNTARLDLTGESGKRLSMTGASVGGGRIEVRELDGIALSFSAEKPTRIIRNEDQPGSISKMCIRDRVSRIPA